MEKREFIRKLLGERSELRNSGEGNKFTPSLPLPHPGKGTDVIEKIPSTFVRYQFKPQNIVMRVRLYASAKPLAGWHKVPGEGLKCLNQHPSQPSLIREGVSSPLYFWKRGATHVAMLPTKAKFAFTLAEVLITLGVIGVVAAMTIPTLMAKIQEHKTVSALKETFSILAQSVKLLEEQDEGKPEEWGITGFDSPSAELIGEKFKKVLKVAVDCGVSNEKNCIYQGEYKYLNDREGINYANSDTNYKLILLNGTTLMFFGNTGQKIVKILVDTNGAAPPNTWGRDLFEIDYMQDIGFVLDGNKNSGTPWDDARIGCAITGWGCAYYVVTFGNMKYLNKR